MPTESINAKAPDMLLRAHRHLRRHPSAEPVADDVHRTRVQALDEVEPQEGQVFHVLDPVGQLGLVHPRQRRHHRPETPRHGVVERRHLRVELVSVEDHQRVPLSQPADAQLYAVDFHGLGNPRHEPCSSPACRLMKSMANGLNSSGCSAWEQCRDWSKTFTSEPGISPWRSDA